MQRVRLVTSREQLQQVCAALRHQDFVALDTEFIRERTYYPQLCLIQAANDQSLVCVDPFGLDDLTPLIDLLNDPKITKVLHAARQDMEIFYQLSGDTPQPLFDTQIAAGLIGYADQTGYAEMVKALLGVTLDKSQARTRWQQRPLTEAQLSYAADDVRYLVKLYKLLHTELSTRGRLGWLQHESDALTDIDLYDVRPEQAWRRVKGAGRLRGRHREAVKQLAEWREQRATGKNRPRQWIMRDQVLVETAQRLPTSNSQLEKIKGISQGLLRRHADTLLTLIGNTANEPIEESDSNRRRLDRSQEATVARCMTLVQQRGVEVEVAPSLLATRRELEQMVDGKTDLKVLGGWRFELVGKDLLALL